MEIQSKKGRVLAIYLPQFHIIPENDQWWGNGFTEWTNVKSAGPLFKDHHQPRVPFNDNYYDLSGEDEIINQANIAKQYGVDGFCYYHYWFKGKQLLQKPLELLLQKPHVDINFCLSWANEPWTRRWNGGEKDVLMPQDYGNTADWETHLNYLIPFFKDERYIKVNGSPLFLIYRSEHFEHFDQMIDFWNKKLELEGINNLYLVETLNTFQSTPTLQTSKAVLEFEPMFTIKNDFTSELPVAKKWYQKVLNIFKGPQPTMYNYEATWKRIVSRGSSRKLMGKKVMQGAFVDWDNTARRKNKSVLFIGASPKIFGKYFSKLYSSTTNAEDEFIFINAWNEWAEGAYLEPDTKHEFGYLKEIYKAKNG